MSDQEAATTDEQGEDEVTLAPDEQEAQDEQDENGQPDELEDAPEPPAPSDKALEEAFTRIERSFKTYSRAVENNLGDQKEDWLGCPLCAPGAIPGYFNRHDIGHVPEDVEANVKMVLGLAREREYPPSIKHNTCGECQGLGKVSTGSAVPEHAHITCPNCRGYGYMPPPPRHGEQIAANGEQPAASTVEPGDFEQPDRDNWGEPRVLPDGTLNDNYGKQPQFKSRHPVYGETRLLTGEELAGLVGAQE